jgi:hypothetical protein
MRPADELIVTVLDDGTVKVESPGAISPANHTSAEGFLRTLARELGGETTRERIGQAHTHEHVHDHEHEHGGH